MLSEALVVQKNNNTNYNNAIQLLKKKINEHIKETKVKFIQTLHYSSELAKALEKIFNRDKIIEKLVD